MADYIEREAFKEKCIERRNMQMNDYTDRDDLIKSLIRKEVDEDGEEWEIDELVSIIDIIDDIRNFPAADVAPVVRCRDCKNLGFKDFRGICEYGPVCMPITPDSFCSWGERKNA